MHVAVVLVELKLKVIDFQNTTVTKECILYKPRDFRLDKLLRRTLVLDGVLDFAAILVVVHKAMEPRRKKRFLDVLVDSLEAINFSNDASGLEVEFIGERRLEA